MKKITLFLIMTLSLSALSFAQRRQASEPQPREPEVVTKDVDSMNTMVDKNNAAIQNANQNVQNTLHESKETLGQVGNTLKMIFGGKKKNKDQQNDGTEEHLQIIVLDITYSDTALGALYQDLKEQKAIKDISKKFSDGVMTISIDTKEYPDEIWEGVAPSLRSPFVLTEMGEAQIILKKRELVSTDGM